MASVREAAQAVAEAFEQDDVLVRVDALIALRAALAEEPAPSVQYGCHMDLEPGQQPDGCWLDCGRPDNCNQTRGPNGIKRREDCSEWRPIHVAAKEPEPSADAQQEIERLRAELAEARRECCERERERDIARGNAQMHMESARGLLAEVEALKAARVPLTDAQIEILPRLPRDWCHTDFVDLVRAIEQAHGIKAAPEGGAS